jgi:hypothetical protein
MEVHWQPLRLVSGSVAFALGLAACHGSPGGSAPYLPGGSSGISSQSHPGAAPNTEERGEIISSCGRHIRIMVAGIVNCRFREPGYGDNSPFTLHNHTQGLILISPSSGSSDTKFTITGVLVGSGFFIVKDNRGHHLTVFVRVRL